MGFSMPTFHREPLTKGEAAPPRTEAIFKKAISTLPLARRAYAEQLLKAGHEEDLRKFLGPALAIARVAIPPIARIGARWAGNLLRAGASVATGVAAGAAIDAAPKGLTAASKKVSGWMQWRQKQGNIPRATGGPLAAARQQKVGGQPATPRLQAAAGISATPRQRPPATPKI